MRTASRRPTSILRLSLGLIFSALLAGMTVRTARPETGRPIARARYLMGTVLEIEAAGDEPRALGEALEAAFAEVEATEWRLSCWQAGSELSRANRRAATSAFPVGAATYRSLSAALALARQTGGAFDPTVGGVTAALGLTGQAPDPDRAAALASSVGWRHVRLDPVNRTVSFDRPGLSVDSGGFAKGEALDRAAAVLRRHGVVSARLNFGGQILLFGAGAGGRPAIRLAAPDASGGSLASFRVDEGSISTSSQGENPGHLVDPGTGRPVPSGGSVTVVADTGLRADALSTALFVMGPSKGLAFADREGIAALFAVPAESGWRLLASREFPRLDRASRKRRAV
jgi:thiamine biosynthesis lipoprotein